MEQWRPVVGWEGRYEVSDHGRVRSLARTCPGRWGSRYVPAKMLTPSPNNHGVRSVGLYDGEGKRSTQRVAILMLTAFVGPCPPGYDCCHWDDDPSNERLENLRWDTRAANQDDSVRNGHHHMAKLTKCVRGHRFSPENTLLYTRKSTGKTRRICRECSRIRAGVSSDPVNC